MHFGVLPWDMQDVTLDELNAMTKHLNDLAEHGTKPNG